MFSCLLMTVVRYVRISKEILCVLSGSFINLAAIYRIEEKLIEAFDLLVSIQK
jgi:hypothetical protein